MVNRAQDSMSKNEELSNWIVVTKPSLLRYARKHLAINLVAHYDPEDILQDSLLSTWKALHRVELEDELSFARWMRRVLRNRAFDLSKRMALRNERGQSAEDDEPRVAFDLFVGPGDSNPASVVQRHEDAATALTQLRELPFEQRLCFVLHDVVGLRWRTLAAILGRSVCGAKGVRHRGQMKLAHLDARAWL